MRKRLDETAREPVDPSEPHPADLLVDFIACATSSRDLSSEYEAELTRILASKHELTA
jgi:hypothetical protein